MPRRLICLLIACYAIAFAFAAMAAIRWPSLMMAADLILQDTQNQITDPIDWRRIGITYGVPYFIAALSLYASAVLLTNRRKGAVTWYIFGVIAGFPAAFLVDFEPFWWQDPSIGEGMVAGAGATALLLGTAVWSLRHRVSEHELQAIQKYTETTEQTRSSQNSPAPKLGTNSVSRRRPVAPAIALQRAKFAEHGHRMLARQGRK